MLSHQSSKDKPHASTCNHFCHTFDNHNFCPTCREAGKGDDLCVTLVSSCTICFSFTAEQQNKAEDVDTKLLGDISSEAYRGSQADLEVPANRLITSPPCPQPLSIEALSL